MNPFKEFLKEKKHKANEVHCCKCGRDNIKAIFPKEVIEIQALGEMAVQKAHWYKKQANKRDSIKYYKSPGGGFELLTICGVYRDIALACLGEEEVKKRPEELNK